MKHSFANKNLELLILYIKYWNLSDMQNFHHTKKNILLNFLYLKIKFKVQKFPKKHGVWQLKEKKNWKT